MDKKTIDYLIKILRKGSVAWSGRRDALRSARTKVWDGIYYKNGNKKHKYQWQCALCSNWFLSEEEMEVDHIVEIGPFDGSWDTYISKMYCQVSELQVLCVSCHAKKTATYNSSRKLKRKRLMDEESILSNET